MDLSVPGETVEAAVDGGVDAVHLRQPGASARELLPRARELADRLAGRAVFVVNDRIDVALAVGAAGAQLGGQSLPLADARRAVPGLLLGVSVHSAEEAASAEVGGADWVLVGTIYATRSHLGRPAAGPGLIRSARASVVRSSLIAIGGISDANVGEVLAAGADGVAVISAITADPWPGRAAERLRLRLDGRPRA